MTSGCGHTASLASDGSDSLHARTARSTARLRALANVTLRLVADAIYRHALSLAAGLFDVWGDAEAARRCRDRAGQITECFRHRFWAGDRCVEYIHPQRGLVTSHGLTDVDWIAGASGMAGRERIETLWPQLRDNADFHYQGMPTGIATEPQQMAGSGSPSHGDGVRVRSFGMSFGEKIPHSTSARR